MATVKTARKLEPTGTKAQKADLSVVETEAEAPPPKPKKKWLKWTLLSLVILLVLGGGAGGGYWYYLQSQPAPAPANGKGKPGAQVAKAAPAKPPQFLSLEPFTVNLMEDNGDHYLQVAIVFQVADDKAGEGIKVYMPIIRDRILRLLSSMRPSELRPPAGKQQLADRVIAESRAVFPGDTGEKAILNAYFASFVIQ